MSTIFKRVFQNHNKLLANITNGLRTTQRNSSYDGDGKMKVKVLNNDPEMGLMINTFSEDGFRLNNNFKVIGPMAIFPRTVLSWSVSSMEDINENSLRLFCFLEPKIDILILGVGDEEVTPAVGKQFLEIMKKYNINIEVLRTEQACTTFNFLNAESRMVAAALIPPKKIKFNDMDIMENIQREKELYGDVDLTKLPVGRREIPAE